MLPLAALLLAGCADSGAGSVDHLDNRPATPAAGAAPDTSAAPAPSTVPDTGREGAVARQVLARYTGWWQAQTTAYADSSRSGAGLSLFATGSALSSALANLHRLREAGMVMQGQPRSDARVMALHLTSSPQTAAIEDCLDVSGWHQADAHTKQLRDPRQRLSRYVVTATATSTSAGWLISDLKAHTGQSC
ncbi:hypothetical protein [Peterkaempfera griseoplana]|uniref:hypothetical protein n=1 Tax=Peterkaempfera griseoplana TaxID=66896 RepID=UPI0006E20385|nr:hypothetical protein [Peterkaempfera griseoplana]